MAQEFRFYITSFGDGKLACQFLNNAHLQIRRFVEKPTKSGKFDGIRAAQALLEGGNKLLAQCRQEYNDLSEQIGQHQAKRPKQDYAVNPDNN